MPGFFAKLQNYRVAFSIAPPKKPRFTPNDIPDLTGRVAIVTGGNRGVGMATAQGLAQHGAKVYIASRDEKKGQEAADKIKATIKEGKGEVLPLKMDLSDLNSVYDAAQSFLQKENKLNIVVCNAAIQEEPATDRTKQGYGAHFGINVIAHHLFIQELLPTILNTAKTSEARIVTMSSSAHYFAPKGGIDFESLDRKADQIGKDGKPWGSNTCYGHSKLGNLLVSNELHRRYGADPSSNLYCMAIHPGNILTSEADDNWLARQMLWPLHPYGCVNTLYCSTAPEVSEQKLGGKYVVPWARVYPPHKYGQDVEMGTKLYDWLEVEREKFLKERK